MTPLDSDARARLLLYAEALEGKPDGLTPDERQAIERQLQDNPDLRVEVERIRQHLRLLSSVTVPQPSADLAARCLEAVHQRPARRPLLYKARWATAGVAAMAMIFAAGMWVGGPRPDETPRTFAKLQQEQSEWIDRLEAGLAQQYHETTMSEANPWYAPFTNLKVTAKAIAAYADSHSGDPVIERGLSIAVEQNISVLKALCEYIESNETIPEYDFQILGTSSVDPGKAI